MSDPDSSSIEDRRKFLAQSLGRLAKLGRSMAGFESPDAESGSALKVSPPKAPIAARPRQLWLNQRGGMKYVQLGGTGLMTSRIVLDLRGGPGDSAPELAEFALGRGVNLLAIGDAAAQPELAYAMARLKERCWIALAAPPAEELLLPLPGTSIDRRMMFNGDRLRAHVEGALEAYGLPRVELLLLPEVRTPEILRSPDLAETVRGLQREGKIRHLAIEIARFDGGERRAHALAESIVEAAIDFEAAEAIFWPLDPAHLKAMRPLAEEAAERNVGIVAVAAGDEGVDMPATAGLSPDLSSAEVAALYLLHNLPGAALCVRPGSRASLERTIALGGRDLTPEEAEELRELFGENESPRDEPV